MHTECFSANPAVGLMGGVGLFCANYLPLRRASRPTTILDPREREPRHDERIHSFNLPRETFLQQPDTEQTILACLDTDGLLSSNAQFLHAMRAVLERA